MTHILIFIHWFVLVFTFGNVELVTIDNSKSNDFPIEELNGYTLREVFDDGQLLLNPNFDTTSYWTSNGFATSLSVTNGFLKSSVIEVRNYIGIKQTYNYNVGDKYYLIVNVKPFRTQLFEINFGGATMETETIIADVFNEVGLIITPINNSNEIVLYDNSNSVIDVSIGRETLYDYVYLYNLSVFGISSLSVEEMNSWFNVYQENEQREISETYDYIENELTTNDLIYIVLFALLWGLAIKIVKGVM